MTKEDKELLLKDICSRLPYGVKILYEGWDSDHGCEFNTVEDLIGIDDRFIYTLWRGERDKHSIVEPLSIIDYKPYLRPMSSMTEKEEEEWWDIFSEERTVTEEHHKSIDWLNAHHFDYRGLIPKGSALEAPEDMYEHEAKLDVNESGSRIKVGCKIRSKTNPDVILSIVSDDCHGDEFECSNGSVLSLKQIEKYYDLIT